MKKTSFAILTLFLLTAVSCKKEKKEPTESGPAPLKSLFFKMDGLSYNPATQSIQHTSGKIFFSTSSNTNESISITVSDTLTPGSYNFSPSGSAAFRMFYTPDNYVTSYTSESGTGTIVSHDFQNNQIQATFNCMLVSNGTTPDTIYVTNGEINKSYPQ
ncbi:hypothetical protein D3C87_14510 [compost metagenome]